MALMLSSKQLMTRFATCRSLCRSFATRLLAEPRWCSVPGRPPARRLMMPMSTQLGSALPRPPRGRDSDCIQTAPCRIRDIHEDLFNSELGTIKVMGV